MWLTPLSFATLPYNKSIVFIQFYLSKERKSICIPLISTPGKRRWSGFGNHPWKPEQVKIIWCLIFRMSTFKFHFLPCAIQDNVFAEHSVLPLSERLRFKVPQNGMFLTIAYLYETMFFTSQFDGHLNIPLCISHALFYTHFFSHILFSVLQENTPSTCKCLNSCSSLASHTLRFTHTFFTHFVFWNTLSICKCLSSYSPCSGVRLKARAQTNGYACHHFLFSQVFFFKNAELKEDQCQWSTVKHIHNCETLMLFLKFLNWVW